MLETDNPVVPEAAPESQSLSASAALKRDIATSLAESGSRIRALVVDQLAQKEIERRKAAVLVIVEKIGEKDKELRKLQGGGLITFDAHGKQSGAPTFTKQQVEEMKKANEEIGKLQSALGKAFDSNDFSKVLELGEKK